METRELPLRFVLSTIVVLLIVATVNAAYSLGSTPWAMTIVAIYIAYFIYGAKTGDQWIWLWLIFGFVTGFVEVASDCDRFLVLEKQVLVYPANIAKIGVSPWYLPFAWGLVFTQLGIIGEWLRKRYSMFEAVFLTAITGAVFISIFENLARQAGWWYYQNTPMLIWAPYFVNAFEFLSTLVIVPLGWLIARSEANLKRAYIWAIVTGVAMGIWMCIAMRIGYALLGACAGSPIQFPCDEPNLPSVWTQR